MKADKVSLFLFIDALGWEVLQRHGQLLEGRAEDRRRLQTILGYSSACDPSIISGLLPYQHGLWSSFYYSPQTCPYRWLRHLRVLPDAIFNRGRVRHTMSRAIKRLHGFTGYFQLYAVPFELLPLFDYAEKRRIWEPGGLPRGRSIFDRLHGEGIPYLVHDSESNDEQRLAKLENALDRQSVRFAYLSLGRLDALMHTRGTRDTAVTELLQWYDRRLRKVLDLAAKRYDSVAWYVFTDHGMHDVTGTYDLMADIRGLGLEWNRDYAAFYDATMARFWCLTERARSVLTQALSQHPAGTLLDHDTLKQFGVYFADGQYGDLVFLLNPGLQLLPSFMDRTPIKGLHGYHPLDPPSYSAITSYRPLPPGLERIEQIHDLMLEELDLAPTSPGSERPMEP